MRRSIGERIAGGAGTALVLTALGAMLLGLGGRAFAPAEPDPALIAVPLAPPPPPPARRSEPRSSRAAAKAPSPPNLRRTPTEIVAPHPLVPPIVPPPVIAAPIAGAGLASAAGASDRAGPGFGAGGNGNGPGGGGDDAGGDSPPRQRRGHFDFGDMPAAMREAGVQGVVSVRYSVETDGRVGTCAVTAGSGNAELDELTCRLIQHRFRFDPARGADGRPFRSTIVQRHIWSNDRPTELNNDDPPH